MKNSWHRQIWFEFRTGHSFYLIFFLSFGTFITVQYKLLFEQVDFLNELFPDIVTFVVVFVGIYIPLAIIIGHLHLRKQIPVESIRLTEENPLTYETLAKSKDLFNIQYRVFEIGMFIELVKELMPNSDKKRQLLKELVEWKDGWEKISNGVSTKDLMK